MFDAGSATFRAPQQLSGRELNVYLTHGHLDHVCGLTVLLAPLVLKELEAVRVHAMPAVLNAVREHLFSAPLFPVMPEFDWIPLEGSHSELDGGVTLRWQVLRSHPGTSLGYRLDWRDNGQPRSLAYITDTSVDGSYNGFIQGVDVLIHECYFGDADADFARVTGHSHTSQVLQLASDCGVGRLVLTHLDPRSDKDDPINLADHRSLFPNSTIAIDGFEIEL